MEDGAEENDESEKFDLQQTRHIVQNAMLRLLFEFDIYRQDMENDAMDQYNALACLYKCLVLDVINSIKWTSLKKVI
jgi:hypothetical protein